MRSTEFLREEGDGPQPKSDAAYAAQLAQGQKNAAFLGFGGKPAAAPAAAAAKVAPAGTSIDPIVRQRLGYGPATQKEIADYQAANPNYGQLVSSDNRPVQSGTPGVTVAAGGEQAVTKAAQTAAPFRPGDAHAGQGGTNYQPDTAYQFQPIAPGQFASDYVPGATTAPVAPPTTLTPGPATSVAANSAAADAERDGSPVAPDALNTIRTNAGLASNGDYPAGELGNRDPSTRMPPAPAPAKVAPGVRPAIVGYASSMGLYKNGRPDTAAIKAFQQKNGLKADGIIGPDTSGAILSAAKPSDAGSGRGRQGGPTSPQKLNDPNPYGPDPVTQAPTPVPVPPMPNPNFRTGTMAQRDAWLAKYGKTHNMDGNPKPAQGATPNLSLINQGRAASLKPGLGNSPMRESKFDESINLMRRLSTMLKG